MIHKITYKPLIMYLNCVHNHKAELQIDFQRAVIQSDQLLLCFADSAAPLLCPLNLTLLISLSELLTIP